MNHGAGFGSPAASAVRLDVWLWRARFWKTRSRAAAAIGAGTMRLERAGRDPVRVTRPSQSVQPGDCLTFVVQDRLVCLEVLRAGDRRGPAAEARSLYRLLDAADRLDGDGGGNRPE